MVQPAHLDLHVGLSEKYWLNLHFWLPVMKHKFESYPKLCVSIREAKQLGLLVFSAYIYLFLFIFMFKIFFVFCFSSMFTNSYSTKNKVIKGLI